MIDINKTFEAECIDDTIGLTKGKKYVVAQSKEYDKYFVLRNDDEEIETYRKERFRPLEQIDISQDFGIFAPIIDIILEWCMEPVEDEKKECYQESEKCPKNQRGKCTDNKICGNQYPAGFDFELECFRLQKENEEIVTEINQLRDKVQQSEFEIKKYTASEIGYKKIIIGLVEALKELTKNVCAEGLED